MDRTIFRSLGSAPLTESVQVRSVCFVTLDFPGPIVSGGIGSTILGFCDTLVREGHKVTVLFVGDVVTRNSADYWTTHYAQTGIRLIHLPGRPHAPRQHLSDRPLASYNIHKWLSEQHFDIVYFHEYMGIAYYSLTAKAAGLNFSRTLLCIGIHGPARHALEANGMLVNNPGLIEIEAMEKECIALADLVISPSQYMLNWIAARKWPIHDRCYVQPNPLSIAVPPRNVGEGTPPTEIVFFGRLELGKGVDIFCDALDVLGHKLPKETGVTFLGKNMWIEGMRASDYIMRRARNWNVSCAVIEDLYSTDALTYLATPGRLAVMPSRSENSPCAVQECLQLRIPFIASRVGGIPELVASDDHDQVLIEPDPERLADALARASIGASTAARPAIDLQENAGIWSRWFSGVDKSPTRTRPDATSSPDYCILLSDPDNDTNATEHQLLQTHPAVVDLYYLPEKPASSPSITELVGHTKAQFIILAHRDCHVDPALFTRFETAIRSTGADVITCVQKCGTDLPSSSWIIPVHDAGVMGLTSPFLGSHFLAIRKEVLDAVDGLTDLEPPDLWEISCRAYLNGYRLLSVPEALVELRGETVATNDDPRRFWRRMDVYQEHMPPGLSALAYFSQLWLDSEKKSGRSKYSAPGAHRRNPPTHGPIPPTVYRRSNGKLTEEMLPALVSVTQMSSATGYVSGDRLVCLVSSHSAGYCAFGVGLAVKRVYVLKADFEIEYFCTATGRQLIVTVDIYDEQCNEILAARNVFSDHNGAVKKTLSLTIEARPGTHPEFRVFWHGNCDTILSAINVAEIGQLAGAPNSVTRR